MTLVEAAASWREAPDAILIDVGSSRTKFAFAAGHKLWHLASVPSNARDVALAAEGILASGFVRDAGGDLDCVVTSVKPELNGVVRDALFRRAEFFVLDFDRVPELALSTLASYVAPDRLANVVAAADGQCPAIIVDFGTATTVDVIDAGRVHLGGVIMPGVVITGDFRVTSRPSGQAHSVLGPDAAARHAAAVCAHAGAVDRLCEMFAQEVGPAAIVATGGFAAHIVPHCRGDIVIDDELTLRGTRRAHLSWRRGDARPPAMVADSAHGGAHGS